MRKCILPVLIFLFAVSCATNDTKVPKDILPVDKMKTIVWDLIQTGEYANSLKEKDTTKKSLNTSYFSQALQLHHISKTDFFKSYNFYEKHPVLNKELFDSVNAYAQRQRNELYKRNQ